MSNAVQVAPVQTPVTVLWRSPDSPRAVDSAILADRPDHAAWLAAMDAAGPTGDDSRFGLDGRIESQVLEGEPVIVLEQDQQWSRVLAPWQPSHLDERGYPGFVRTAHLDAPTTGPVPALPPTPPEPPTPAQLLSSARTFAGVPYLWGGVSATAVDCSGLVHLVCRRYGLRVPRDADDQQTACSVVPPGTEQPGDLYFFAHPGQGVHHVGFVTERGAMLHAPGTGHQVVEEALPPDRVRTLAGAGRLRAWSADQGAAP